MSASEITEVRHFEDLAGVERCGLVYRDGETYTFAASWATAREIAERAGLEHRDDEPGCTVWSRRS